MKTFHLFLLTILSLLVTDGFAHPSWGIVVDKEGCIFFVDVMHHGDGALWKIDPDDQSLEAIFKRFHAHQIEISAQNILYAGIAIWRTGEIEGEGHNFLFRVDPYKKKLDTLLFSDDWDEYHGQVFSYSEEEEVVYFAKNKMLMAKPLNGHAYPAISRKFGRISTITKDSHHNIWMADTNYKNGTLFKWDKKNGLIEVANNLIPDKPKDPIFDNQRHQFFSCIQFSKEGEPMVTDNASRSVQIVKKNKARTVYISESNWAPYGIYYHEDKYYIMEAGFTNRNIGPRIVVTDADFNRLIQYDIDFATEKLIVKKY